MPGKIGVASVWPIRFTDIIFASIIVSLHKKGGKFYLFKQESDL